MTSDSLYRLQPPANGRCRQMKVSPPAEREGPLRDKMCRQTVKEKKDPRRCHRRHRIDAAGCQGWRRKKGPWKRVSDTTQRKSQRSTRRRNFNHQAMSGGPFCRPAGPAAAADEQARAKEAAAVASTLVAGDCRNTLSFRQLFDQRRPLRGAVVRRECTAAAGACDFQSPGRRDRDWPRREGYPQPSRWQHDVAIPHRKRRCGAHPRYV